MVQTYDPSVSPSARRIWGKQPLSAGSTQGQQQTFATIANIADTWLESQANNEVAEVEGQIDAAQQEYA